MSEFDMIKLLQEYNSMKPATFVKSNLMIDIDEGADGLYALRVTDTNTGAIWWATVCETYQDAIKAVESLFETEQAASLQKQLDHVNLTK